MVMRKRRIGAMFTMEAFLAAMLVLVTIFFLYSDPVDLPSYQENEVKRRLRDCLVEMDISSELRNSTELNSANPFEEDFSNCLPPGIEHEVVLCDDGGCSAFEPPEDRSVVSSRYFVAGVYENFPKEIIVYGWSK